MTTTTFAKLNDGTWGLRGMGEEPRSGETVTVSKRSGETQQKTVGKVLWAGRDKAYRKVWLATISEGATRRTTRCGGSHECRCGGTDDLLSLGYRPGQRVRCDECGGWGEAC